MPRIERDFRHLSIALTYFNRMSDADLSHCFHLKERGVARRAAKIRAELERFRAAGYACYPACDNCDSRGVCQGHDTLGRALPHQKPPAHTSGTMKLITLHAKDADHRIRAFAVFQVAYRWNDVLQRRQHGYTLYSAENVDFGSQSFWLTLPIDTAAGVVAGPYLWQRA